MKTIGMIGGMSWESSIEYYRILNETVKDRLGGLHSARSVMYSVDFAEIEIMQSEGRWEQATQVMIEAARHVEAGGADFLIICTNTMHKMANAVEAAIHIPLLHIADATARAVKTQGFSKIALLGTKFTMEEDFYRLRLAKKYGLEVLIPDMEDREIIHSVIYDELVLGDIKPESREKYKRIIGKLIAAGAQGIILGCTEIGLLVKQDDSRVPLFDTTYIHATSAVELALE
jgi:aspartate racemase